VQVQDLIRLIKLPVPPTRSTTHTLIYLTSGEANITIGSRSYTIYQHECVVVPAGQVYSFAKPDINKGFLCNFHNDTIVGKFGTAALWKRFEFLQVWGNPFIRLPKETSAYVLQLFKRIYTHYKNTGLDKPELIQSNFIALLCEIHEAYKPLSDSRQTTAVTLTNAFKELVFKHVRSKHLVTEYAALLHVSPNHLNKIVKQITGRSPIKWIDEAIVLEGKVLLHQTDLSVSGIAAELGITDASYFSRLFKKYESLTPLQFRQRIEKS
jgi:AraC family transcriptional activator of pobA